MELHEHAACTKRAATVAPNGYESFTDCDTTCERNHSHSQRITKSPSHGSGVLATRPVQSPMSAPAEHPSHGLGAVRSPASAANPKPRTADYAVGRWPGILQGLGIDPAFLNKKHGPCPICAGTDRYRFDDRAGRGTWICSHCGAGDGFRLLQEVKGWSFRETAREVDRIVGTVQAGAIVQERTEESKVDALRAIWKASRAVTSGDPVALYLARRVGISSVPADLRYHPNLMHSGGGTYPAMLAMMRYPDGTGASIHRTYLTTDGHKAEIEGVKKFMQGKPLKTTAVRLGALAPRLGIAEGVETALAAAKRFGLPVWAATNAVLLECWVPPAGVEVVLIAGDNDAGYTGQAAAHALAKRLVRDGYSVEVRIPEYRNSDWCNEANRSNGQPNSQGTKS